MFLNNNFKFLNTRTKRVFNNSFENTKTVLIGLATNS